MLAALGCSEALPATAISMQVSTATCAVCWAREKAQWHYTVLGAQGVASRLIRGTNKVGGKDQKWAPEVLRSLPGTVPLVVGAMTQSSLKSIR